jgi:hypothetical protein
VNYCVYNFAVASADPSFWDFYVLVEAGKMYNINKTLSPFESFICRPFPLICKFLLLTPDRPLTQHFCDSILSVYNSVVVTHIEICIIMLHVILSPNLLIVSLTLSQLQLPSSYFSPPTIGIFCSAPERIPTSVSPKRE